MDEVDSIFKEFCKIRLFRVISDYRKKNRDWKNYRIYSKIKRNRIIAELKQNRPDKNRNERG